MIIDKIGKVHIYLSLRVLFRILLQNLSCCLVFKGVLKDVFEIFDLYMFSFIQE